MKSFRFFKNNTSRIAKKLFDTFKKDNSLNQKDKKINRIESGRTMMEMLGVLAVIGVLSVGGILGYKYGITKWKANETVNELNLRAHDISFRMEKLIELNHEGEIEMEMGNVTRLGYPIMARMSPQYVDYFEMFLSDVPSDVCKELLKSQWQAPYSIFVGVTEYEATADICDQSEHVELAYEFYKDLTRKEDVPEESRHKIQRCKHENHCQCGTCNENTGLCESFCVDSESCAKDYDDARWMVCCDKNYVVNGFCCASITEDGQCCNRNGKCCPPDKPLQDSSGKCHSCDETGAIGMADTNSCSAVCPKRYINNTLHKRCILCGVAGTDVADKPIWDWMGNCYACNYTEAVNGGGESAAQAATAAQCSTACPNRFKDGAYCYPKCPDDKPLFATDKNCYPCDDTTHAIPNSTLSDTCENLCPKRKVEGDYCVADCPKDKPLKDKYGACYSCDITSGVDVGTHEEYCAACPKRYTVGGYNNQNWCSLCGVAGTSVADMPLSQDNSGGNCASCDHTGLVYQVGIKSAYLCENVCSNRQLVREKGTSGNERCVLPCPAETPLRIGVNSCTTCDYNGTPYSAWQKPSCSEVCSDREDKDGLCVLPCPKDKPLRDKNGLCYSCEDESNIDVSGHPTYCDVCENREMSTNGQKCALKCGMKGTSTENNPIMSYEGNCQNCNGGNFNVATADKCTCENKKAIKWSVAYTCASCGVKGTENEDKPLFDTWTGGCHSCDDPETVPQVGVESQYLCHNLCPNRILNGSDCKLKCTGDTPLTDAKGNCYDCNDAQNITLASISGNDCETLCPNRVSENGKCVRERCADGYFEDKNGTCYSCRITTPIAVKDEENCKICLNRIYQDGNCIENTQ